MIDKVAVSHRGALRDKYGARLRDVEDALGALVRADRARGIVTEVVYLDDVARMESFGVRAVDDPRHEAQVKAAVDAVNAALDPGALLLVGASDVVPHQTLDSPLHDPTEPYRFPDLRVPSDLPYAHDAPGGRSIEPFLVPQRDLGRIPGHVGSDDPEPLLAALAAAARGATSPRDDFLHCFAVSAGSMRRETELSLEEIFGAGQRFFQNREDAFEETRGPDGATLQAGYFTVAPGEASAITATGLPAVTDVSVPSGEYSTAPTGEWSFQPGEASHTPLFLSKPPTGPPSAAAPSRLQRRAHFINAHGDHETPYVRHGPDFGWEIILTSDDLEGQVRPGTVVAGIFCYAAELYDPDAAGRPGICSAYLSGGAAGFFGATNYTFGSPDARRYASYLARLFFQGVLDGLPLGEAVRTARLQYLVEFGDALDPMDLKVLGQFTLLGDPLASPVRKQDSGVGRRVRATLGGGGGEGDDGGARMSGREPRVLRLEQRTPGAGSAPKEPRAATVERERRAAARRRMKRWARTLERAIRTPELQPGMEPAPSTLERLEPLLRSVGLREVEVRSYLLTPRGGLSLEGTDRGVPMLHLVSGCPTVASHAPWTRRATCVFAVHIRPDGGVRVFSADRH